LKFACSLTDWAARRKSPLSWIQLTGKSSKEISRQVEPANNFFQVALQDVAAFVVWNWIWPCLAVNIGMVNLKMGTLGRKKLKPRVVFL
jgi:hypothetical protein